MLKYGESPGRGDFFSPAPRPDLAGGENRRVRLNMERAPSAIRRFEIAPPILPLPPVATAMRPECSWVWDMSAQFE